MRSPAAALRASRRNARARAGPCVEALYATYNVCMKAGRKKCDAIPPAGKFKCLKDELSLCALTRNKEEHACLAESRSCYAAWGPLEGKRADYRCTVDFDFGAKSMAAFCAADPASPKQMEQCAKVLSSEGQSEGSMSCESL